MRIEWRKMPATLVKTKTKVITIIQCFFVFFFALLQINAYLFPNLSEQPFEKLSFCAFAPMLTLLLY